MSGRSVPRRRRLGSPQRNLQQEPIGGNYLSNDENKRPINSNWQLTTTSLINPPPSISPTGTPPPLDPRFQSLTNKSLQSDFTTSSSLSENSSFATLPASQSDMPCAERTTEFRTVCKSMQMKGQANKFQQPRTSSKATLEETKQFNLFARSIGRDLGQTCAKLEKLIMLAKKKSLFDDRNSETDELTHIIKQDIAGLNRQIAQLQEYAMQRTGGSNHVKNGNQSQHHSKSVVVCLQSKLASMSNEFKQVLDVRTKNLKDQRTRRERLGHDQLVPSSLPRSASAGQFGSVLLSDDQAARSANDGSVILDMNQARQQQQVQLIDDQDQYVRSRAQDMETVESTVVELGQIFSQLAHMVQEQGEMVQRIDSNVEDAALNVEAAHMELLKYFRNISNNRWLALKVFGILIIMFIIFIVFLV